MTDSIFPIEESLRNQGDLDLATSKKVRTIVIEIRRGEEIGTQHTLVHVVIDVDGAEIWPIKRRAETRSKLEEERDYIIFQSQQHKRVVAVDSGHIIKPIIPVYSKGWLAQST